MSSAIAFLKQSVHFPGKGESLSGLQHRAFSQSIFLGYHETGIVVSRLLFSIRFSRKGAFAE
jgi:hypothetical protein